MAVPVCVAKVYWPRMLSRTFYASTTWLTLQPAWLLMETWREEPNLSSLAIPLYMSATTLWPSVGSFGVASTHTTPLFMGDSVKPQAIHPVCERRNTCCQEPLWVRRELNSSFSVSLGRVNNTRKASAGSQEVAESPWPCSSNTGIHFRLQEGPSGKSNF